MEVAAVRLLAAMYEKFYGLRELPFELIPNPKYLYLAASHREALSNLQYGLSSSKSVTVLIGEAGTGKTTLLHAALASDRCRNVQCVYMGNPALTRDEFISILAYRFNLTPEAARSKGTLLIELDCSLRERRSRGERTALVIDEAQSLSDELLEEVRLLANLETTTEKLLPLVLAGQPEFGPRLDGSALRALKQRVTLRCEIGPFQLTETASYIANRIRTAGGDESRLFTRQAVESIHEASGGVPRTINVLCDNALVSGLALRRQPVDRAIILEVCRDFHVGERDRVRSESAAPASSEASVAAPPETAGEASHSIDEGARPGRFTFLGLSSRRARGAVEV